LCTLTRLTRSITYQEKVVVSTDVFYKCTVQIYNNVHNKPNDTITHTAQGLNRNLTITIMIMIATMITITITGTLSLRSFLLSFRVDKP